MKIITHKNPISAHFHARGHTFTEISILQKVAESRNLCDIEIWNYMDNTV